MSERKYYWLKLKSDFFAQKEIKKLRRIAGGDTYTIIYLKMQLRSLESDGKLFYEGVEDSFIDELALDIDEETENVKVTVIYLEKHGLLEKLETNDIEQYLLVNVKNEISCETSSAARVRRHRAKQKSLQCNGDVTPMKQIVNGEKEIEKEIDIDKKKSIKENDDRETPTLQERIEEFKNLAFKECSPTNDQSNEFNKFLDYWTEYNDNGKKFRKEMQNPFSTTRRWKTWLNNSNNWQPQSAIQKCKVPENYDREKWLQE